jgi:hypothetical protein
MQGKTSNECMHNIRISACSPGFYFCQTPYKKQPVFMLFLVLFTGNAETPA